MPNANAHKIEHITGCRCGCGASFDYSQFEKLSDSQLYLIDGFITPRIFRVLKADPVKQMNAIEISLVDAITSAYGIQSKNAIDRAVKVLNREAKTGKWNQSKIDKILQPIADAIGPKFSQKQASRILQASIGIYNIQKKFESDRAGIKPSFTVVDDIAKRGIAQNNMYWIGARYGNDIGPRLRAIVGDILITQGLPLNEAADAMARAMGITLGVARKGAKMPEMSDRVQIPRGFTGSSRDYFRGVASAIRTTGTSFASIQTFQEVGFNWYVLSNPMDSQTTRICAFMNGKVFRVSDGVKVMNNYMAATTPADAKAAMPWMNLNELGRRAGFTDASDFEQKGLTTATLAAQNVALSPFHFRCRTVAEPSGSARPVGAPRRVSLPSIRPKPKPGLVKKPTEPIEFQKFNTLEEAESFAKIIGAPTLPKTAREASIRYADSFEKWAGRDKLEILGGRSNLEKNWAKAFRKGNINKLSEKDMLVVQNAINENWTNIKYREIIKKTPGENVIFLESVKDQIALSDTASGQMIGGTEFVFRDGFFKWASARGKGVSGRLAASETFGGKAAVIRHEMGHKVYDYLLSDESRSKWAKAYRRVDDIADEVTIYAAKDRKSDEGFCEVFSIMIDKKYKRENFSSRFNELRDVVSEILGEDIK